MPVKHLLNAISKHRKAAIVVLVPAVVLAAFGAYRAEEYLTSTEFCSNACHVMEGHSERFKVERHSVSLAGGCAGCHIEPGLAGSIKAKIAGAPQLWQNLFGSPDPEKLTATRASLDIINKRCFDCHSERYTVDLDHLAYARNAQLIERTTMVDVTCVDCHGDIGHSRGRYDAYAPGWPQRQAPVEVYSEKECLQCHVVATPQLVKDWLHSQYSAVGSGCHQCHGENHNFINLGSRGEQCRVRVNPEKDQDDQTP